MNKKFQKQQQQEQSTKPFYKRKYFSFIPPIAVILIVTLYLVFGSSAKKSQSKCFREDFAICYAKAGKDFIQLKVAYSDPVKAHGLMGAKELKPDSGMIFVYDYPQILSFWMKDTNIPLTIAYVDPNGIILGLYDMNPEPNVADDKLRIYDSPAPVQYAIEVNKGWFRQRGIKEGDKIELPLKLTDPTFESDTELN